MTKRLLNDIMLAINTKGCSKQNIKDKKNNMSRNWQIRKKLAN